MALAFAQNLGNLSTGSATSLAGTFGSSTVSGNAIAVGARIGAQGRTVTASDNKSNSYSQAKNQTFNTGNELFGHYALNVTGGASHQVTVGISGAAASIRFTIHEESGVATSSALDQSNSGSGSSTAPDSGNVTTTVADEWIFGICATDTDVGFTAGASFGHLVMSPSTGGSQREATEDRIVSATSTYSAPFTVSPTNDWGCIVLAFKAAGAGGTTFNDSGTGTITLSGTDTQAHTHSLSAAGTITLSGTATQSMSHAASGSGTLTLSGSGSQSQTHTVSGAGSVTLSGTFAQSQTHSTSAAGTVTLSGFGAENFVPPGGGGQVVNAYDQTPEILVQRHTH